MTERGCLALLNESSVWTAHCYASGDPTDGGKAWIPTLKVRQAELGSTAAQVAEMNQEQSHLLWATFFPELMHEEPDMLPPDYPEHKFHFSLVTDEQIHGVISKLGSCKVPG